MSTVTVIYYLSDQARRRIAVETGEVTSEEQTLVIDLAPLTPDERARLLKVGACIDDVIKIKTIKPPYYAGGDVYASDALLDGILTGAPDVLAQLDRMDAERAAAEQAGEAMKAGANAKIIAEARAYLESGPETTQPGNLVYNPKLFAGYPGYDEAVALIEQVKAEDARRSAIQREREEAEKERADAKRAAKHAARLAWAEEHGSDRLKRGLRAGHDCARLYYQERAAVEYPGYVYDHDDSASWNARACPSAAALDELDAVKAAHPGVTIKIVWLTTPPASGDERDEEWQECEAVVVDDSNYSKWLVKEIEE